MLEVINDLDVLPIRLDDLERFRLDAKRHGLTEGMGAHLRRQHGQSLEFREYRNYLYGDDVRTVDWRTSMRVGGPTDWVVRTFDSEEHLTLAISVDTRPSMYLPADPDYRGEIFAGAEKVLVASWLVRSFAELAAQENDRLLLHRLFTPTGQGAPIVQAGTVNEAEQFAEEILHERPAREAEWAETYQLNAESLLEALPPASVLIVVSDLYFEEEAGAFSDLLLRAQQDYREVVLVRLESWPSESRLLLRGVSRVQAVEGIAIDDGLVEVDDVFAKEVRARIEDHVARLLEHTQGGGLIAGLWSWPEAEDKIAARLRDSFAAQFLEFAPFQSIFARRL